METTTTWTELLQHPILCAEPFLQHAALGEGPVRTRQQAKLRQALRELLRLLTTADRAIMGGNFKSLELLLLRADINARGLLGRHYAAAYEWLRISWREPTPPPEVAQAFKVGLRQLTGWVRHHSQEPELLTSGVQLTSR